MQYEFPYDYSFAETLSLSLTNLPRMALEMSLCLWAGLALFDLWIVKGKRPMPSARHLPTGVPARVCDCFGRQIERIFRDYPTVDL